MKANHRRSSGAEALGTLAGTWAAMNNDAREIFAGLLVFAFLFGALFVVLLYLVVR